MKAFFVLFLMTGSLFAQASTPSFTYKFRHSSLPPEFHRSYTIGVTEAKVHLVVDSYGDVLLDETYDITQDAFKDFVTSLKSMNLKIVKETGNQGCTGGTADSFVFTWGDGKQLEGHSDHCGGTDSGNLKGSISKAVELFKSMVPDFELKLGSTFKN